MPPSIITLTTDFGRADTYVAQVKGVILSINPDAAIVDVTHEIPPQDIMRGSIALGEMWQTFPVGTIHVAVVDPGVGTSRCILCAKCDDRVFVLPNNGLLSHVLKAKPADEIVELRDQSFWRTSVSNTFHGRDIIAPVAAHLSLGVPLSKLGPPAGDVTLLDFQKPRFEERQLFGTIVSIDRFGNLITDIELAHLRQIPTTEFTVCCKQRRIERISRTYADYPPGTLIALPGSQGRLELAIVGGNASLQLDAKISDAVVLSW
ncbi:MAG: SAM-dependent chlorinase/fluorinase [Planctomycetota bacterium]|nr:SAM-dependent chlorinase/fluorinase [Planctomycetota bacterium]